jgi:hypothetical protein
VACTIHYQASGPSKFTNLKLRFRFLTQKHSWVWENI